MSQVHRVRTSKGRLISAAGALQLSLASSNNRSKPILERDIGKKI
jgi:hypothetical protein